MYKTEYGTLIGGHTVQFERLFPGPVALVWCYLTTKELLATWLGEGRIECRIGGYVRLETAGSSIQGVVTECRPYSRLAHSWNVSANGGPSDNSLGWESFVTFDLRPQGDKVLLKLAHSPIPSGHYSKTLALWHSHLDRLVASIRQQHPEQFLRRFNRVLPEYERQVMSLRKTVARGFAEPAYGQAFSPCPAHA